jgi:hypothetical protein
MLSAVDLLVWELAMRSRNMGTLVVSLRMSLDLNASIHHLDHLRALAHQEMLRGEWRKVVEPLTDETAAEDTWVAEALMV